MSYFEEIGLLDRPFVNLTVTIRGQSVPLRVRALSAKEQDELEALQMDEYGRLLTRYTQGVDGEASELDRVVAIYATKSAREIIEQILPTREEEALSRALDALGLDLRREIAYMNTLEESEREKYAEEQNARIEEAKAKAKEEIRSELSAMSVDDLARTMGQVNINIKAQRQSTRSANIAFLYFALYRPDRDERVFKSPEEVAEEFTDAKIIEIAQAARTALVTDLPFVSPDDEEPPKQPSSQSTSEAAMPGGGKRTRTTRGASKRSTTPA